MLIYPTIELQKGRCVSLRRGKLDEPLIWHVDPVAKAKEFADTGAEWLHITDLDAVSGDGSNRDIIQEIILHAGIPVQVSGGIRTLEHVEHWVEDGVGRAVIGTAAVLTPDLVHQAARRHPDQVVLSIDVWRGEVMTHGWTEASVFAPVDFMRTFRDDPLAAIIFTDIDRDMDEPLSSVALTTAFAAESRSPVISSGLVKTIDDISVLKYVYNIAGAIVGRALFERTVDLAEALEVAASAPEPVPEPL
ncbi:MAG: HisA/HisF-related TIM barrel protein [Paracoccaceae bacterium]